MGVEAAVGPHRERPTGAGMAHPSYRLAQEVSSTPSGAGPAAGGPGQQHAAGAGGDDQQRMIAPGASVAVVAGALLGQAVGLADGRIQVDGEWCVAGVPPQPAKSGPSTPGSPGPVGGHGSTGSCAGRRPEPALTKAGGGGCLDHAPQHRGGPPRTQRSGVVNLQSPPASAEAASVSILSPAFARPGASPRSR